MGLTMMTARKEMAFNLCGGLLLLAVVYLMISHVSLSERLTAFVLITRCFGAAIASSLTVASICATAVVLSAISSWSALHFSSTRRNASSAHICIGEKTNKMTPEALWQLEESIFEAIMCIWMGQSACNLGLSRATFWQLGQVLCQLLQRSCLLSSGMYICISLSAMVIPVIHTMCCFAIALIFFIPLLGRSGPVVPLDVVLSLLIMVSYSARVFCFLPAKQLKLIQNICIVITVVSTAYASI
ncbi:hypothetical protein DD237_003775 [Peronospora effusa]|uniref:Uncharacterized protein n=1 Tax=Peronospora effusa TaxID=542832 RepID=A0A425C8W1_9STRA|nr:hypothetical protein DD237_003775 [Peronospora effusa]